MFHVVISDSIYWMKVEIWGDEKKTLPKERCRGQMAKIREGRDLESDTPLTEKYRKKCLPFIS